MDRSCFRKSLALSVVLFLFAGSSVVFAAGSQEGTKGTPQKVTIRYEAVSVWVPIQKAAVAEFNRKHPNIDVVLSGFPWTGAFERLLTHFAAGTAPDVIGLHSDWIKRFSSLGYLQNLDSYVGSIDIKDFWPDMVQAFKYKGKLYAIPSYGDVWGWTYNVNLYKEAGLDPQKPPQNWGQELEQLQKLTNPEKNQYGFGLFAKGGVSEPASLVNTYVYQNDGNVLNGTYTKSLLDQPAAVQAVQFVTDMCLKYKVCLPGSLEYTMEDMDKVFANGGVAVYLTAGSHVPFIYKYNPNADFQSAPIPGNKQWKGARMYGWSLAMYSASKEKNAAWKFIEFMNSPEIAQKLWIDKIGTVGPRMSVALKDPKLSKQPYTGYIEAMKKGYGQLDPPLADWQQIVAKEVDAIQSIFLKQQTASQAMKRVTAEIDAILKSSNQ